MLIKKMSKRQLETLCGGINVVRTVKHCDPGHLSTPNEYLCYSEGLDYFVKAQCTLYKGRVEFKKLGVYVRED
jgi:hypothetical protein